MARSGNPNPVLARIAKARKAADLKRGAAGDLTDLRACLWLAILKCTEAVNGADELTEECRKTITALGQVSAVYIRLVEAQDLETRVAALEAQQHQDAAA